MCPTALPFLLRNKFLRRKANCMARPGMSTTNSAASTPAPTGTPLASPGWTAAEPWPAPLDAPRVLLSLPDLRSRRPIPVASPKSTPPVYAPAPVQPQPTVAPPPSAHAQVANTPSATAQRQVRFDAMSQTLQPVLKQTFQALGTGWQTRQRLVQLLASRNVWYVIAAAVMADLLIVWQLALLLPASPETTTLTTNAAASALLPSAVGDSLPLPSPLSSPTITPLTPQTTPAPARPVFPANSPRLGAPGDLPPWDNWPSSADGKGASFTPPGSRESTANTPAQLPTVAMPRPIAPLNDAPAFRTARTFDVRPIPMPTDNTPTLDDAAMFDATAAPGKAKLLGVIRKPHTGSEHERARSGLY